MAQRSRSFSRVMDAVLIRVACSAACLAGTLPGPAVALPVLAEYTAAPDETVMSGLPLLQTPAALPSDPLSAVKDAPDAAPYPQRQFDLQSDRPPTRAQPDRKGLPPGPRQGVDARPAALGPPDAPLEDALPFHEGTNRPVLSLGDLLPMDEADEMAWRQAARTFAESTSEAVAWLQPALDTLRDTMLSGATSGLLEGLSAHAGSLGGATVTGAAMAGAGTDGIAEPVPRRDLALVTVARQPAEAERNVVRELIDETRRMLDQPMAWFIIFVMMVGWLAVSAAKRWLR